MKLHTVEIIIPDKKPFRDYVYARSIQAAENFMKGKHPEAFHVEVIDAEQSVEITEEYQTA